MATPPEYLELARSVRQNARSELFRIRFPFAVRYIFSGLRISIALAVIGAVVAEFVSAGNGLGYVVYASMAYLRTALAFGALAFLAIIGITLFNMVALTQRMFFPWASEAPGHEDDAG
jgi:NitT/TauT family transport system permease protein